MAFVDGQQNEGNRRLIICRSGDYVRMDVEPEFQGHSRSIQCEMPFLTPEIESSSNILLLFLASNFQFPSISRASKNRSRRSIT